MTPRPAESRRTFALAGTLTTRARVGCTRSSAWCATHGRQFDGRERSGSWSRYRFASARVNPRYLPGFSTVAAVLLSANLTNRMPPLPFITESTDREIVVCDWRTALRWTSGGYFTPAARARWHVGVRSGAVPFLCSFPVQMKVPQSARGGVDMIAASGPGSRQVSPSGRD